MITYRIVLHFAWAFNGHNTYVELNHLSSLWTSIHLVYSLCSSTRNPETTISYPPFLKNTRYNNTSNSTTTTATTTTPPPSPSISSYSPHSTLSSPLRLRYMNSLTNHQAPMQHKRQSNRMELERTPLVQNSQRDVIMRPPFVRPERHDAS